MAPPPSTDANPALAYLLLVLSTAESFKADYRTVAEKAGLSSPKVVQRKFKKVVEQFGFTLVDGMIKATTTTSEATGGKRKAEGGGRGAGGAKRSKKQDLEVDDDGGDDEIDLGEEGIREDEGACGDEESCEET